MSVENFYWVVYQNLLKPLQIDVKYYYPWGTRNCLSEFEFQKPYLLYHFYQYVLFHDQEPLWNNDLGESDKFGWSDRSLRIMANSERSGLKTQVCKDRSMLDWYYFYHGFAAQDWYRDAQFIDHDHDVDNAFLSLNHVVAHHRCYRIALLANLVHRDVTDRGVISWHADFDTTRQEIENPCNFLSDRSRALCRHAVSKLGNLPWTIDDVAIGGDMSAHFGHREYRLWQRSLLHIVNETVFYQNKLHLTEKIFKPIVAQRPFILVAAPGNLGYLKSYGFETFDSWIDERYDEIQDPDERLDAIAGEVARFATMDRTQLRKIQQDMRSVLRHNRQHFFGEFQRIIVNELVDNFDRCIRIWNNGRIDGRELPWHPDLDGVKKILLA